MIHIDKDDPSRNDFAGWRGLSAAEYYGPCKLWISFMEPLPQEADQRAISILYTNHRGEKRLRRVIPLHFVYGVAEPWHCEPQWLMVAYDLDKGAWRIFGMDGVSGWNPDFHEGPPHVDGAGKGG